MRLKHFTLGFGSQIFRSLSDESRVRILNLLHRRQRLCISDLEMVLDFTQTKTSRHLIYLKNAGLLANFKVDQWVFYYIKDEVKDVMGEIFKYLEKDSLLMQDIKDYDVLDSNRELAASRIRSRRLQQAAEKSENAE